MGITPMAPILPGLIKMPNDNYSLTWPRLLLAMPLLLVGSQQALAQWDFQAVADLGAVYTDNLRIANEGMEESEIVYTISPTFTLSNPNERFETDIRYRPEAYFYSDNSDYDEVYHVVDANIRSALIRDALFLNLSGTRFQTTGTGFDALATSNLPITGNRVDSTLLEIRPSWQQDLGFAQVLAEIGFRDSRFDDANPQFSQFIQDNTQRIGRFNLNNLEDQSGIAWGVEYVNRRAEYDLALPYEYQSASANLGYWFNGTFRVFGLGGRETPFDSFLDASMDDDYWEAGFQYRPSQRFDLEIAAGRRSFGDSLRGRLVYQLRRGTTQLSYSQGAATRAGLGFDQRPIVFADNLDTFLDRPGAADRFVLERGEWMTTIGMAKSDVSLRLFSEERTQRTTDIGDPLDGERLAGAAFRWSWRRTVNSTVGFSADLALRDIGIAESDVSRFAIDYAFQLSRRMSVVLLAQRAEESGDETGFRNYVENQIRISIRAEL